MNSLTTESMDIDKKVLEVMKLRLINLERNNLKTKERSESEMINEIKKVIMEEVNKNY